MSVFYDLYVITNKINNKKYVGQTMCSRGVEKRFREHLMQSKKPLKKSRNPILYSAIRKYGEENFCVKRILKNIPQDKIDYYEKLWIYKLDTFYANGKGYNMTSGVSGVSCYKFTDEVKKSMSDSIKKFWDHVDKDSDSYKEMCEKRSKRMSGRVVKESTKKKLSEIASKRLSVSNPFYGKKHSESSKNKISEANGRSVIMLSVDGDVIKSFCSAKSAGDFLVKNGITGNKSANCRILLVCHGKEKTAYGYIWKFK